MLAVIKSISYPNSKAAHLIGMAQKLLREYAGEVPSDIDQLMTLPGVGRKTANVLASVIYDKPVIAVDTHVFRVSHRMGLSDGKTVEAVEKRTGVVHPGGTEGKGTSLADPPWTVHVHGPKPEMRRLPAAGLVPRL